MTNVNPLDRSSAQRLNKFVDKIFPSQNSSSNNDVSGSKSRWVMWRFNRNGSGEIEHHQMNKSESKLFNRLFDRLNPSSGKARQSARAEIIKLLESNGLKVSADIRKHLPNTYKLGNIHELGRTIKAAMDEKKTIQDRHRMEFANAVEVHIRDIILHDANKTMAFFRDSKVPASQCAAGYLNSIFKSVLIDFSRALIDEISSKKSKLDENQLTAITQKKLNQLYREITNSQEFIELKNIIKDSAAKVLDELHEQKEITDSEKNQYQESIEKLSSSALILAGPSKLLMDVIFDNKTELETAIAEVVNQNNLGRSRERRVFQMVLNGLIKISKANKS